MAASELQQLLAIPPSNYNGQDNNPHAIAHAVLENLRDSGDPNFLFIRTALEQPNSEELLFHCITGCRHVVLTRWDAFSEPFTSTLRDLFMCLGDMHPSKTIRMACYTTSVAFWKRQWCEHSDIPSIRKKQTTEISGPEQLILDQIGSIQRLQNKSDLFHHLRVRMTTQTKNSCEYMSSLIGEFSGKSVVPYRLPMEFHKCTYRTFENENLEDCLKISMGALSQVVGNLPAEDVATSVVQVAIDVLSWEFGGADWMHLPSSRILIRPPGSWAQYLMRPDFIGAMFAVHEEHKQKTQLAHGIRQLLLLLCSLTGPIFREKSESQQFANFLCEGTHKLLNLFQEFPEPSLINDAYSLVSRLVTNFRLGMLSELPSFIPFLHSIAATGKKLLEDNLCECEGVGGDFEAMENREWRDDALSLLLQDIVLLCKDPWLNDRKANESDRREAQLKLMQTIGGLYPQFVRCRTKEAFMSEHYMVLNNLQAEEADEEIVAAELDDELAAIACIGRLHLMSSLSTMSSLFQEVLPRLQAIWQENTSITADASALLKEASLLMKYLGHLLADEIKNDSTGTIPSSIETACQWDDSLVNRLASVIRGVLSLIEAQASSIVACPSNPRLSPSLTRDFVWFLKRWVPSYVCSARNDNPSKLALFWSSQEAAHQVIEFSLWVCQRYFCYWPHIESVNESATELLIELAKCNATIRGVMIQSNSFREIYQTECRILTFRHGLSRNDVEVELRGGQSVAVSTEMAQAFYSLPSETKSGILAFMIIASGDPTEASRNVFSGCLEAVHDSSLNVLGATQTDMAAARTMIAGCLDLLRGVVYAASEVSEPERIPRFMNPLLPHLSALMDFYSRDISICEGLLCLFRDYAESCALSMSPDERLGLFEASSNLLKKYSEHHCTARVILARTGKEAEEEEDQAYSDILCALELLINLSNTIDQNPASTATDVVFFGLQQIVPLMTQGLLSYPSLCTKYLSLVSFMMEKHPGRITIFPFELLDSLLQSLLYGSTHHDSKVAKTCLEGLEGLAKAHLQSEIMRGHLAHHPDVLDRCTKHLFMEVIFQQLVWDRLDETSNALLVLVAADIGRFGLVARELEDNTANLDQRGRLHRAFEKLVQQDVIAGALLDGYEGRSNRRRFKDDLEAYANEVHSFLLVK
jgi:hypothetical protein